MYKDQADKLAHLTHSWMERAGLPEDHALWAAERQIQRDNLLAKVELQERLLVVPTDPHNRRPTHPHNHHALTRTHIHPHPHQYSHMGARARKHAENSGSNGSSSSIPARTRARTRARTHARTHAPCTHARAHARTLTFTPLFPHTQTATVSSRSHDLGSPGMILGRLVRFRLGSADSAALM